MEGKKEDVPPAYANEVPDIHDEKATGKIVQEEAVHSVALAEALQGDNKPSPWSRGMIRLYMIMGKHMFAAYCAASSDCDRNWLPCFYPQRLRLLFDGCHQCYGELPDYIRPYWCWQ